MKKQNNPYLTTEKKYFLYTFRRQPLLITKAKGSSVWDDKGKHYFDFFSGLAVCGVGHNNTQVVNAIKTQTNQLIHSSNYFYTKPQMELAKKITRKFPKSRVFFSNSGAEANELAIKLCRLWAHQNNKKGREIIVFSNAFHGRTLATVAASDGKKRINRIFDPLPQGFRTIPFNDLDKAKKAISDKTIAFMLEPVQGEAGINISTPIFLKGLAQLCRSKNLLLVIDEVQSGLGRTGTFFAFEQYGIKPDIVTMAKGLAGGLPLGATLAQEKVWRHMEPGYHGSTFGGNPVSCAASLEVLKLLTPSALKEIRKTGQYILEQLSPLHRYSSVKDVRGKGLMIGIELNEEGSPYVDLAREKGLLINCTQKRILRFLPPYFMKKTELDKCLNILKTVFEELRAEVKI